MRTNILAIQYGDNRLTPVKRLSILSTVWYCVDALAQCGTALYGNTATPYVVDPIGGTLVLNRATFWYVLARSDLATTLTFQQLL